MKFDELDDDTRDVIIFGLMCYSTEVDDFIFKLARSKEYDRDGDVIE